MKTKVKYLHDEHIKCSIVMPTYNKGAALDRTLNSIFSQFHDFCVEVIVVDDGSTDETQSICRKYYEAETGMTGLVYFYLDRPYYTNPAKARNIGYSLAQGDIIISQSSEVEHVGNCIVPLVENLTPNKFLIATVLNINPITSEVIMEYTGVNYQRPLFFLGSIYREDVLRVGGDNEDFVHPGYEDTWFGHCLVEGHGLEPEYRTDIVGHHWDHSREGNLHTYYEQMSALYEKKIKDSAEGIIPYYNDGIKEREYFAKFKQNT